MEMSTSTSSTCKLLNTYSLITRLGEVKQNEALVSRALQLHRTRAYEYWTNICESSSERATERHLHVYSALEKQGREAAASKRAIQRRHSWRAGRLSSTCCSNMITFPEASFLSQLEAPEATAEGGSEEWKDIFLPDIYGSQIYVSRNRFCGKIKLAFPLYIFWICAQLDIFFFVSKEGNSSE